MWIPRWIERLHQRASDIQESLKKQESAIRDAVVARENDKRQAARMAGSIARAIKNAAADVPQYEKTQRDKEYFIQKWTLIVAIGTGIAATLTAVGAFIYAHIAAGQLDTMNRTLCETIKSTNAAHESVELTKGFSLVLKPLISPFPQS